MRQRRLPTTNDTKPATPEPETQGRQWLTIALLPDGALAPEREPCPDEIVDDATRATLEQRILQAWRDSRDGQPPSLRWLALLGMAPAALALSPSAAFWRELAGRWLHGCRANPELESLRENFALPLDEEEAREFFDRLPPMVGIERASPDLPDRIWTLLNETLRRELAGFPGSCEEWFQRLAPESTPPDRIHFHLVENRKAQGRPFAFLATYTARVDAQGRTRHLPLKFALEEFKNDSGKLLELLGTVRRVARDNSLIRTLVDTGEIFQAVGLTLREALDFLRGVSDFEEAGILCRIPRWWSGQPRKARVSLSVGGKKPAGLGRDALLSFDAALHLEGHALSVEEARRILAHNEELTLLRGQWVTVDTSSLASALDLLSRAKRLARDEKIPLAEAMRLLMGARGAIGDQLGDDIEVTSGAWLNAILDGLRDATLIREVIPPAGLTATLRPYQRQGLGWLSLLHSLGFGACLADDMGLGKTVQVLALLLLQRQPGRPALVVAPATLLENWRQEIARFTPELHPLVLHPSGGKSEGELRAALDTADVAITTYGLLHRWDWLHEREWPVVVCDEAQAIKNPASRQSQAARKLHADFRIAMTGTPVENSLIDLWALFDFANPGLLGNLARFKRLIKDLPQHPEGYGRLRRAVQPYILRRSKTDKNVINDLPDKVEMKTFCPLSRDQVVLYHETIRRLELDLQSADGMARRGLVLATLLRCKQLCNHPDHHAGSGRFDPRRSGKFGRLAELCATIRDKREKVLIFTQFREIIAPLDALLTSTFGRAGAVIHGGSSIKARREAVERMQAPGYDTPYMLLSLKAGGTGLNLTAANHVIHFDRWWNPAVENQATDRAFRIGQTKKVMVHKFICQGTVEDKIDALIEGKKKLAAEVMGGGQENWLTELDDQALRDLFRPDPELLAYD